jgi:hypothetical protein
MFDAEITLDRSVPTDALYMSLSVDQKTVRVTVHPETKNAQFLALLEPSLGLAIADALDGRLPSETSSS